MGEVLITRRGGSDWSETNAILRVTAPTGSTFTAAKNGVTLSPKMWEQSADAFDTAIFTIPASSFNASAWTISATDGTYSSSDTVVINGAYEFNIALNFHVPDGYQEVEYIESSEQQYINTGINPTSTLWGFEVDFSCSHTPSSTGHAIFGQKTANDNEWHLTSWFSNTDFNGTLIMKGNRYAAKITKDVRHQMSLHNLTFINGEGTRQTVASDTIGNLPLYIFAINNNGTPVEYSGIRLYHYKIFDNTDTLVSDLYPCYRISDSVAGLWDKEREIFLTNQGSGSFIVGADVGLTNTQPSSFNDTVPKAYQAVEYLQSSGTQYILTSIPANTVNSGTIDFMSTSLKQWTYIYGASSTGSSADPGGLGFSTAFGDSTPYRYGWVYDSQYNSTSSISVNADTNVRHTAGFHYLSNNIEYMLDDKIMTKSYTAETYTITTNSITLFTMNYNGTVYDTMGVSARVYSFKLYNSNGDIILDCRPCYRKSDSAAGMWDSVSKTFLTNSGSGTFTVGANV